MKHKIIFLFLALAAMIGLVTAQSSQGHSLSGSKSGADPATKPLSPKSAMPAQHKSSVPAPVGKRATGSTTSELKQLEHQNQHASASAKGTARGKSAPAAKPVAQAKSTETSTANGSGVDFKYQKPKGGMRAETPDPNTANSNTPRVKKKK